VTAILVARHAIGADPQASRMAQVLSTGGVFLDVSRFARDVRMSALWGATKPGKKRFRR
jgi:hypothetical protein